MVIGGELSRCSRCQVVHARYVGQKRVDVWFNLGDPGLGRIDQIQGRGVPIAQPHHGLGRGHANQFWSPEHLSLWSSTLARCGFVVQAGPMIPFWRLIPLLVLGGCTTLGPNFASPGWSGPGSWFGGGKPSAPVSVAVEAPIDPNWWTLFDDPVLTALEQRVASENLDVAIAAVRIEESRAQYDSAVAAGLPTVIASASYTRQKASNLGAFANAANPLGASGISGSTAGGLASRKLNAFDVFQVGFDASWELDLWGRIRRSVEAAKATTEASEENRRGVLLFNLAEVARDYISLRGVQTDLRIARDNSRIAQDTLKLTQQRAAGGVTTTLDVSNALSQLSTTLSQIPVLEQQEAQLINALSLLLGMPPNGLRAELQTPRAVPPVPPRVPVGLPSELARRRPDVREAEARLHATTANIGVATAAFYPSVTLSGSTGLQSLQLASLFGFNARQYALGPSISVPIFEGGRLKATLYLNEAQQKEAALGYQQTVLRALHEVDNALTAYRSEQARRQQLTEAVAENRRALDLAKTRYAQGVSDFLTVLDTQRSLLVNDLSLADSTTAVSTNLVALYKALGGGWEADLPDAPKRTTVTMKP
jgi:NodT family efflux transporter outer membrane factor (OMF) lipoprotein